MLNYEEGGENTPLEGDPASEAFLHEVVGAPPTEGRRNLNTESMFEFGSRAGFWRVHRIFTAHGLPLTVFAVGQALERNPEAAQAMIAAGWEVASHGWRWIDYGEMPEDEEREHMRRSIDGHRTRLRRPARRLVHGSRDRRRPDVSSSRTVAFSTTPTRMRTSSPTGWTSEERAHLVIPYTLDANDFKFLLPNGFVTAGDFAEYLIDSLEQLRAEGGRMLSVGLHCRIIGRPGRAPGLARFLEHVRACDDVWVATRADIARHWQTTHPPPPDDDEERPVSADAEVLAALRTIFDADTGIYRERGFQRRIGYGRPAGARAHRPRERLDPPRPRLLLRRDGHHHPRGAGPQRGRPGEGNPRSSTPPPPTRTSTGRTRTWGCGCTRSRSSS